MDKIFTVNFDGGPALPMMNLIMDGRGDPYGVNPVTEEDGHTKSRHLVPFVASVQRGAEVLCVVSAGEDTWAPLIAPRPKDPPNPLQTTGLSFDASGMPTRLYSHLVLPIDATVSFGDQVVSNPAAPATHSILLNVCVEIRYTNSTVVLRTLHASRPDGSSAQLDLVIDETGIENGVMRLTWTHADSEPQGRGTLALWVRAGDTSKADSLRAHVSAPAKITTDGDRIDVAVEGMEGTMRIVADCEAGDRIQLEGAEPTLEGAVLSVNGLDVAKEIWGSDG
jgi:hypothetical protein